MLFRHVLLGTSSFLIIAILGGMFVTTRFFAERAHAQIDREAQLFMDAFSKHVSLVLRQVDMVLHGVRMIHLSPFSLLQSQNFMEELYLDHNIIEDVFVTDAQGRFLISTSSNAIKHKSDVQKRKYFLYHKENPQDVLYISTVEKGIVSKEYRFRVTRRWNQPDGSFGGVVVVSVIPKSFIMQHKKLFLEQDNFLYLLGSQDHKIRAMASNQDNISWQKQIESPVFDKMQTKSAGAFEMDDNKKHLFYYKEISHYPLVILLGYAKKNIKKEIDASQSTVFLLGTVSISFLVLMTFVLQRLLVSNSELKTALNQIKAMSMRDQLTGSYNRHFLERQMQLEIKRAQQFQNSLAIILCDLDNFKLVNDRYGHGIGDEVLKYFVEVVAQKTREQIDFIVRYGGEEFLIVLPQTNLEIAENIAERIRLTLEEQPFVNGKNEIPIRASFGVTAKKFQNSSEEEKQNFISFADVLLYQAKSMGKNKVVAKPLIPFI